MNQPQATIATAESQVSTSANGHYAPCQECGAPLDRDQRYCISCGARRGDAANPTSRYFAAASRQRRALATRKPGTRSATSRAAVVGFFVLLPVAVAAGVLVGRSGMNNDNGAVQQALEALRNQPATAVTTKPRVNQGAPTAARQALATFRTKVRTVHRGRFCDIEG